VRLEGDADVVLKDMSLDNSYPLIYEDFAAREMWKVKDPKYGEMLDKFRTAVKRVVFGILYGAGAAKIAETIGISKAQAQAIIEMLFRMFPSIPRYIESTKWELWQFGCVETYFGRRRRVQMKGLTGYLRSRAERQAVNFKIQSTSSDIVMGRLIDVAAPLERDLHGRLLITVHDSIAFELPKKYLSQLPDFVHEYLIKRAGEKHTWLPVEFSWDFEVGNSYGELTPYEEYMKGIQKEEIRDELEEAYSEEEVREDLVLDAA
jgi:DNA polymerase I-like protein with 3'-5' exonuclease and polymerase domains